MSGTLFFEFVTNLKCPPLPTAKTKTTTDDDNVVDSSAHVLEAVNNTNNNSNQPPPPQPQHKYHASVRSPDAVAVKRSVSFSVSPDALVVHQEPDQLGHSMQADDDDDNFF
jgi:hypothetical protein